MNALPICDNRYIKTKIRTYDVKAYTHFCYLNVAEDGVEHESVTVISVDSGSEKNCFFLEMWVTKKIMIQAAMNSFFLINLVEFCN